MELIASTTLLVCLIVGYVLHITFIAAGNLVDWQIRLYLKLGLLKIDDIDMNSIQPNSLDLRLARDFAKQNPDGSFDTFAADQVILEPGEFVLATTVEYFRFPSNLHGVMQGKSSWARVGLYVESAGLFDSGFEGEGVVELTNQGKAPLVLEAGKPIAQMIFTRNLPVSNPYGAKKGSVSHYQGQRGARQSCLENVISKTKIPSSIDLETVKAN